MAEPNPNDKILSYNDVVLRRSDLKILSGPYFLNDRIIEFYFSYLTSIYTSEEILLIPPSIAFWIKECQDTSTLIDFIQPLNLSRKNLIIFPINDNSDVTLAEGGTHWSLLAYEKKANVFVHHDSSGIINGLDSRRVYRAAASYVSPGSKYVECSSSPRQTNGYDCGLYVTAIARAICEWYGNGAIGTKEDLWFPCVKEKITPEFVHNMRGEILELVRSLMAEIVGPSEQIDAGSDAQESKQDDA